jgi:ADP-ribose pyrophosphatase YjhB (NUDIX family)
VKAIYSEHTRHLAAIDCIVFGYDLSEKELKLLLIKRSFEPEKGKWSLAGGFVGNNESLDDAAIRILRTYTGLEKIYLKQSFTYGDAARDPGARVISTSYYTLIAIRDIDSDKALSNGAHWRNINNLPDLIFDHEAMVRKALSDLRYQIRVKPVGFELLPPKFTLVQLQELYEAIYGRKIDRRNFRKKIISMGILEKLDEKEKETSKKGAFYYRFNKEQYDKLESNGSYFNLESV